MIYIYIYICVFLFLGICSTSQRLQSMFWALLLWRVASMDSFAFPKDMMHEDLRYVCTAVARQTTDVDYEWFPFFDVQCDFLVVLVLHWLILIVGWSCFVPLEENKLVDWCRMKLWFLQASDVCFVTRIWKRCRIRAVLVICNQQSISCKAFS